MGGTGMVSRQGVSVEGAGHTLHREQAGVQARMCNPGAHLHKPFVGLIC
jgi:hypothetical protein